MMENGDYAGQYDEETYMEQEEEWEREGLLDPAWEKQQKKVSKKFFYSMWILPRYIQCHWHNALPKKVEEIVILSEWKDKKNCDAWLLVSSGALTQ